MATSKDSNGIENEHNIEDVDIHKQIENENSRVNENISMDSSLLNDRNDNEVETSEDFIGIDLGGDMQRRLDALLNGNLGTFDRQSTTGMAQPHLDYQLNEKNKANSVGFENNKNKRKIYTRRYKQAEKLAHQRINGRISINRDRNGRNVHFGNPMVLSQENLRRHNNLLNVNPERINLIDNDDDNTSQYRLGAPGRKIRKLNGQNNVHQNQQNLRYVKYI